MRTHQPTATKEEVEVVVCDMDCVGKHAADGLLEMVIMQSGLKEGARAACFYIDYVNRAPKHIDAC